MEIRFYILAVLVLLLSLFGGCKSSPKCKETLICAPISEITFFFDVVKPSIVNPDPLNPLQDTVTVFPYLGALKNMYGPAHDDLAFCTSTLTGSNEITSAAHCFTKRSAMDFTTNRIMSKNCPKDYTGCTKVYLGQSNIMDYEDDDDYADQLSNQINVKDVYVHEHYFDPSEEFFVDDIALVILERNVTFPNQTGSGVADMPSANYQLLPRGTILGWGKTSFGSDFTSYDLRHANVSILDHDTCQARLDSLNATLKLSPGNICSFGEDTSGSSPCRVC